MTPTESEREAAAKAASDYIRIYWENDLRCIRDGRVAHEMIFLKGWERGSSWQLSNTKLQVAAYREALEEIAAPSEFVENLTWEDVKNRSDAYEDAMYATSRFRRQTARAVLAKYPAEEADHEGKKNN